MRSNYKKIGPYIRQVDVRNAEDKKENLLGVSTQKVFIDSIANTIGTDFRTYKIVKRRQFTYVADTSRRGDKIGIALLETHDEGLVSPIYTVFEITDENVLLPEYLMMWFRRPEFDRYARFKSHGSVRELFDWEEMCDVELPMPSTEKQREIVKEYHTIVDRIKLNERLNQKLEETAQAIYKQWFVDFEFPISAEYAATVGKPELEGQPYKSSGGEMIFNEVLKQEIPKGWKTILLGQLIESVSKTHSFNKKQLIFFNTSDILNGSFLHSNHSDVENMPGQAKKSIKRDDILYSEIRPENRRFAMVRVDADDYVVSTKLMVLRRKTNDYSVNRIYNFITSDAFILELHQSAEGRSGTFPQITFENDIEPKTIIIADEHLENKWEYYTDTLYSQLFAIKDELLKLFEIKELLLSKISTVSG